METNLNNTVYEDYDKFKRTGISPLSMLNDNSTVADIVTRYQSMFTQDNIRLFDNSSSKTSILKGVKAFTSDNQYYSGFAFQKPNYITNMVYPLTSPISDNFSSAKAFSNFQALKSEFEHSFKIKVQEKSKAKQLYQYKKSKSIFKGIKNFAVGTCKLCATAFTFGKKKFKKDPVSHLTGSKIILKVSNNTSSADKIAKMYNVVTDNIVSKLYKKSKYASSNQSTIKLISSLIATQYTLLSCNFGNDDTTKFFYSSLAMQISNAFASLGTITQNDKNIIKTLSLQTTDVMLKKLGKTPEDIANNLSALGYEIDATENGLNDVMFGNFKQSVIEPIEEENNEEELEEEIEEYNIEPVQERQIEKSASKLKRKTVLNNIDNNICKVLAKTVEDYNTKYISAVSNKKKQSITREKNMTANILNYYELMSYDFAEANYNSILKELRENKLHTDDDYAKLLALTLLRKRNAFLDSYFDEKTLKTDKELEVKTYANVYKLFIDKFGDAKGATFKTKFQNFMKTKIKESFDKIAKTQSKNNNLTQ